MGWVYGIQSGLFIKVGVAKSIKARLYQMNLYNPHPCKVVVRRQVADAYRIEKRMHEVLAQFSIGREWFMCDAPTVRKAFALVLDEAVQWRREETAWRAQAVQRADEREANRTARAQIVQTEAWLLRKIRKANKIKMIERLNEP